MDNLVILLIGEIFLLLFSIAFTRMNLFSPSVVANALFLFGVMFVIIANKMWNSSFSFKACMLILSGMMLFTFTEFVCRSFWIKGGYYKKRINLISENDTRVKNRSANALLVISVISTVIVMYSTYRIIVLNGYRGGIDFTKIASYYHTLSFRTGRIKQSALINLIQDLLEAEVHIFLFYILHRVIYKGDKLLKNLKYFIPLLGYSVILLMRSNRGQFIVIMGYVLLISFVLTNRKRMWKHLELPFFRYIYRGGVIAVICIILFYLLTSFIGRTTNNTLFVYIAVYVAGPIIHFNQFIVDPPAKPIYFGQETFGNIYSILNKLGITDANFSNQLEFRNLGALNRGNIYTFFRRPLNDFGVVGMLFITAVTAAFLARIYYKKIYKSIDGIYDNWVLILYAYCFRIIFVFSFDNYLYSFLSIGKLRFFVILYLMYNFLFGSLKVGKRKIKFKI